MITGNLAAQAAKAELLPGELGWDGSSEPAAVTLRVSCLRATRAAAHTSYRQEVCGEQSLTWWWQTGTKQQNNRTGRIEIPAEGREGFPQFPGALRAIRRTRLVRCLRVQILPGRRRHFSLNTLSLMECLTSEPTGSAAIPSRQITLGTVHVELISRHRLRHLPWGVAALQFLRAPAEQCPAFPKRFAATPAWSAGYHRQLPLI